MLTVGQAIVGAGILLYLTGMRCNFEIFGGFLTFFVIDDLFGHQNDLIIIDPWRFHLRRTATLRFMLDDLLVALTLRWVLRRHLSHLIGLIVLVIRAELVDLHLQLYRILLKLSIGLSYSNNRASHGGVPLVARLSSASIIDLKVILLVIL